MVQHYVDATGEQFNKIMSAYDSRTEDALISLVGTLPADVGVGIVEKLADAADQVTLCWQAIVDGEEEPLDTTGRAVDEPGFPRVAITPADGEGDAEHPTAATLGKTLRLQMLITSALDASVRNDLRKHHQDSENHCANRRLDELSDREVSHGWLWHLNKHRGPLLTNEEFLEAIRIRLGCAGPTEPVPCARCGEMLFDSSGSHAACCAIAESTRGHYGVVKQILSRVLICDPSAETEVPGLIPGIDLRPADILTQALGSGLTALDVGITSPDALYAGLDCTESMVQRKLEHYSSHLPTLERQNIEYIPLVFSSYGRPNARTVTILRTLSKRISRRRGTVTAQAVYHSLQSAVSTEIWRRAAKQVFHCWPGGSRDDVAAAAA